MEASLRETNLKNFIRLLQCASKFGDELNIHANKDLWELGVTNSSRSAFCLFKLRPSFFCRYKALGTTSAQRRGVTCQLLVKSVLAVLGKNSTGNVDRLDLKIVDPEASLNGRRKRQSTSASHQPANGSQSQDDAAYEDDPELTGIEAKLIIKLVCKHGVTKKHSLHLASSDFLRAEVNPDTTPSSLTISAKSLRDILDHFAVVAPLGRPNEGGIGVARGENQLGWMFTRSQVRIKSWEGVQQALTTEIKIDAKEFGDENYWVEERRVDLTIPMKEFRATLTLAEQLNVSLHIAFSEASQPVTLISHWSEVEDDPEGDFDIFCAIATTTCDAFKDVPFPTGSEDRKPSKVPFQAAGRAHNAAPQENGSRARSSSVVQQKTKRTKLDMSTGSGSQSISMVYNSAPDPLSSDGAEGGGSQPASQGVRMSQAEILEMAGLNDLNEDELADELDRAEDEDEEEELRASQMQIERDGGIEQESIAPGAQEITSFEPDPAVFQELIQEDEDELLGTQSQRRSGQEGFQALFED